MIIAQLVSHEKSIQNAMEAPAGTDGLYKAIIQMLVESWALYPVNFLLAIGTRGTRSRFVYFFLPILRFILPFSDEPWFGGILI